MQQHSFVSPRLKNFSFTCLKYLTREFMSWLKMISLALGAAGLGLGLYAAYPHIAQPICG
jgi:hypothetical protein